MNNLLVRFAIWILDRSLRSFDPEVLTKEQEQGLLSQMWENASFRNYIGRRNSKLIFSLVGGEGMAPEPREDYIRHTGQRVEILLLASRARNANQKMLDEKRKAAIAKGKA